MIQAESPCDRNVETLHEARHRDNDSVISGLQHFVRNSTFFVAEYERCGPGEINFFYRLARFKAGDDKLISFLFDLLNAIFGERPLSDFDPLISTLRDSIGLFEFLLGLNYMKINKPKGLCRSHDGTD